MQPLLIPQVTVCFFDTGPRFGRSDVLPVLRFKGTHNIDQLLLSHDAEPAGGVDFFRDYFAAFSFTRACDLYAPERVALG